MKVMKNAVGKMLHQAETTAAKRFGTTLNDDREHAIYSSPGL